MGRPESILKKVDIEKIKLAIKLHTPIEVVTYTLPRNMELYIYEVLSTFLSECHQEHMIEYLKFCLGELLTNSKKANTKRVYFKEKNLDINDELNYHEGMISYKADTLENINHYLEEQKKAGLYIKFSIQLKDDSIIVEIKNNSILTPFEKKRIQEKIKTAQKYNSAQEVMAKVLDQTEGAGLGIIIIILMLEKIGLSKQNYKVFCTETDTVTRMELPLNQGLNEHVEILSNAFLATQDAVPVFQDKLEKLHMLCENASSNLPEIKQIIFTDLTLSVLLLQQAAKKDNTCDELSKALELVSTEELKDLYSKENQNIRLITPTKETTTFWEHSFKSAFYAYNFAVNYPIDGVTPEQIYTYALLHDLEGALLAAASESQKTFISKVVEDNKIPGSTLSLFKNNACHSKGGCIIARKWGLSEKISNIILFHNNPDGATEDIKRIVDLVYLGAIIQYYNLQQVEYYQINETVLKDLDIESEEKLQYIINQIEKVISE